MGKGARNAGGYIFCGARLPVAGPARKGGGSHDCSAPRDLLMARNHPRRRGEAREGGSHGCSALQDLLMARNHPRRQGEAREGSSHGCYTPEAVQPTGDPGMLLRSPLPAIWPYLEYPVGLINWSNPPTRWLDKLGEESNPPSGLDYLRVNALGRAEIFSPSL